MITKVSFQGGKGKIAALLQMPDLQPGSHCPICVVLHGIGDHKDTPFMHSIGDILERNGIGSLRIDFNGHGDSDGSFTEMTIPNEVDDAEQAVLYAKSLSEVSDIFVLGHSQGGVVSCLLSAHMPDDIKGIALMAPAFILHDGALKGNILGGEFDPNNLPETLPISWGVLGKNYISTAQQLDIYGAIQQYGGPLCIVHGTGDAVVPMTYADQLSKLMPSATYHRIEGLGHSFEPDSDKAIRLAAEFFKKNIL